MSPLEPFDFRKLMGKASEPAERPDDSGKCIVGVAWTGQGIGIVALPLEAGTKVAISAYNNIVLGPIESDWPAIAAWIQFLPKIFKGREPSFFLSGAVGPHADHLPVVNEFERAFPGQVKATNWQEVEDWVGQVMPHIGAPRIPAKDWWAIKPIHAAAETALYCAHQHAKSCGSSEGEAGDGK